MVNIINITKKYSFSEVLKELSEDNALSFLSNGNLYFMFDNVLKTCEYTERVDVYESNNAIINKSLMEANFYLTDIYISSIVVPIEPNEIKDNLLEEKLLMFVVDENCWVLEYDKENNSVSLDYTQIEGIEEEEDFCQLFIQDVLQGLICGSWHVINKKCFN